MTQDTLPAFTRKPVQRPPMPPLADLVGDPVEDLDNDDEFRQSSLDRWPRDTQDYLMGHRDGVLVFAKAATPEEAKKAAAEFVAAETARKAEREW